MLEKIISNFEIRGDFVDSKSFGNGHINDTFLILFNKDGAEVKYILRKINKYVFKNPEIVVNNTVNIIKHISAKLKEEGIQKTSNKVMELIKNKDGTFHFVDVKNDYWCMVVFIDNSYTIEHVETVEQAYQAAKAFGRFQRYLIDADVNEYKDTIPNFHNLAGRLKDFDLSLKENLSGRIKKVLEEIKVVDEYRYLSKKIAVMLKNNELPIRVTHNDTKINNVMINKHTNKGECVIDLDTVMPGTVLNDFGDMVRTSTSPVNEDEKDSSKVKMRLDIFEGLVHGYLEELACHLSKNEIENLVYGAMVITYEQLIRFLTDYLNGDIYYNTNYDEHNLVRARTQIALLKSIIKQKKQMEEIIIKYYKLYFS
jgi:hypothetical protein